MAGSRFTSAPSETSSDPFDSAVTSHAEFDPHTLITKVSVLSAFNGISRDEAKLVSEMAQPPNWANAVPNFFRRSEPGCWNEHAQHFEPDPAAAALSEYQLLEVVDFRWSPAASTRIENVLDIARQPLEAAEAQRVIRAAPEGRATSTEGTFHAEAGLPRGAETTRYRYALSRCVSASLLSGNRRGGIDVDEGSFTSIWLPSGRLCISAVKSIRYEQQANTPAGMATGLNLLAPGMMSFLMRHLAYGSIHDALTKIRSLGGGDRTERPTREVDALGAWASGMEEQASIWFDLWSSARQRPYGWLELSRAMNRSVNASLRAMEQALSGKRRG